jgi:hypothetical protein
MLQANQATAVLKTAIDLGIFAALAEEPRTAEGVAAEIDGPPVGALAPGGRLAVHDFVTGLALENPGAA